MITTETGGYSPAYLLVLVMMMPWRGNIRKTLIILAYLYAFPLDMTLSYVAPVIRDTYIGHSTTIVSYSITLSPFVRPAMIIAIGIGLALLTFGEVWSDIRRQGWQGRWRYRQDAPLLPGVEPPARVPAVA